MKVALCLEEMSLPYGLKPLDTSKGTGPAALKEWHSFKAEMDDEARQHMFRHLAAPAS